VEVCVCGGWRVGWRVGWWVVRRVCSQYRVVRYTLQYTESVVSL
jgi:hypothetical protein